jgi:serine protease AprX
MAARNSQTKESGIRMSALWGTGGRRGEGSRNSVLWGKGGRNSIVTLVATACVAMLVPFAASAQQASSSAATDSSASTNVYAPTSLVSQAQANPQATFNVIVQGADSLDSGQVAQNVATLAADANNQLSDAAKKASDNLQHAQDNAAALAQRVTNAQANAAALAQKATTSGKRGDQNAAAKAAQAAAQAQQAATSAQTAVAQAQSATTSANGAVGQLAGTILNQQVSNQFSAISGVSATLTGDQINSIVSNPSDASNGLISITPDSPVYATGAADVSAPTPPAPPTPPAAGPVAPGGPAAQPKSAAAALTGWSSTQLWPYASTSAQAWSKDSDPKFASKVPAIAIVDSGIQARSDFGSRIIASVNMSSLPNNSPGDGRGHGTFVAGIAAGELPGMTGANPAANLVNVDVLTDSGMGLTSDIINACQWILNHKDQYNIRVVNLSLNSSITAPFFIDPLDQAVEQLWFNGIVVVTAAGNYGTGSTPSGVLNSPADDPFVITVGAADLNGSVDPSNATMAPWSAWGSTLDGFAKPELSAPGRYMTGPVPTDSTLVSERPDAVTSPGYMQLSGTSFAAPVVSGAAANILAQHPDYTPDQVKGALMLTATPLDPSAGAAGGVGVIQAGAAMDAKHPPNPNQALEQFVKSSGKHGSKGYSFDAQAWAKLAQSNASWNSASWNSASWNSASWNSASWNSASWNSASWNSASWNSASWDSASWDSVSWNSVAPDGAKGDTTPASSAYTLTSADVAALFANPLLAPDPATVPASLAPSTPSK